MNANTNTLNISFMKKVVTKIIQIY